MESITAGMRRLLEDAAWFTRAKELKLLHVATTTELAGGALKLLVGQEFHADNKSLFFAFEEAHLVSADGWYSRSQTLRKQYGEKQRGLSEAGIALPELGPAVKREPPVAEFSAVLQEILSKLRAPIEGVVLVFAPTRVEPNSSFVLELRTLLASPALRPVRFIVMERDEVTAKTLAAELGPGAALVSEWIRDEKAAGRDLAAMIGPTEGLLNAPAKTPAWWSPGAMPDVEPPPRLNQPPQLTDEQIREQGLSPEFVHGGGRALQRALLGAALAAKEGRQAEAIQLQGVAVELCKRMSMPKEEIINLMVLAAYYLAGQSAKQARSTYERAVAQAAAAELKAEQAQAHLALGLLDALEGQHQNAMTHYSTAGEIAEAAGNPILAMEAWRTAGQLAFNYNAPDVALQSWLRGLKLAATLPPNQAKATSAAEIARGVATVFGSRGQHREASALHEQAFRYEHGLDPTAVVPQA